MESVGVAPLIKGLDDLGGWPIIGKKSPFNEKKYDFLYEALPKYIAKYGGNVFFSIAVYPCPKDNNINCLYVSHYQN